MFWNRRRISYSLFVIWERHRRSRFHLKLHTENLTISMQDLKRIKTSTTATAAELREFLRALRGKTPTEMLGIVASSSLFRSLIVATIGTAALIAVFTIIPFAWGKIFHNPDEAPALPVAEAKSETPENKPANPEPSIDTPKAPDRTIDALGVGESKNAPPRSNPLEGASDDLLDGLE